MTKEPEFPSFGRFFQLGYVTRNIDAALERLKERTGANQIDLIHDVRDEKGQFVALEHLSHLSLPGVEFEVIQPRMDWPSIYVDALPACDDDIGLHHLGFIVSDEAAWDAAVKRFGQANAPIAMAGETSKVRFAYIDARAQMGHYVELVLRYDPENARALPT